MKIKSLILVAIVAAASCGCSSTPKINQKDIVNMIHTQKCDALVKKAGRDRREINLYYRGWNESADNIVHHILQK
jgi:hypothetical protein|tara:strand:+ start:576 stop:800 length:225 start_codon:yes stop_codon:yes gene_type:complete